MNPLSDLNIGYGRLLLHRLLAQLDNDLTTGIEKLMDHWAETAPDKRVYSAGKTRLESDNLPGVVKGLLNDDGGMAVADSASDFGEAVAQAACLPEEDTLKFTADISGYHRNRIELLRITDEAEEVTLVGKNPAWLEILTYARKIAVTNVPVLITGETGTGKERVADYIHHHSPRRKRELSAINCGALPDNLVESELFGYDPGAFTGADKSGKLGRFQAAAGGTVLLDDIDGLSPRAQAALLRFIENGEVQRLGSSQPSRTDVRIICTCNKDLSELMRTKRFRRDLYYRLNIFRLQLPPLRERREDIPLFARYFLRKIAAEAESPLPHTITEAALNKLSGYKWQGNLREMYALLWRAVIDCETGLIHAENIVFEGKEADDIQTLQPDSPLIESIRERLKAAGIPFREIRGLADFLAMNRRNHLTNRRFTSHFGVSPQTARNRLKALVEAGILQRSGERKGAKYYFKETDDQQ